MWNGLLFLAIHIYFKALSWSVTQISFWILLMVSPKLKKPGEQGYAMMKLLEGWPVAWSDLWRTNLWSCLENPRNGGAWWAAVYGVTQSQTWLKWLSSRSSSSRHEYTGFCHSGKKNIYILQIFRTLFYTYCVIFTMILWHEFSIFPNIFLQRLL